jgi:glucose/arabinose dehydrogenase
LDVLVAADGHLYFTDDANKVYKYSISASAVVATVTLNTNTGGLRGLAIHPTSGILHVVYGDEPAVYSFDITGGTLTGPLSVKTLPAGAVSAWGIAFEPRSGNGFVTSQGDGRLYTWSGSGNPVKWNTGSLQPLVVATTGAAATSAVFNTPTGVAFSAAGNMLISEAGAMQIVCGC